MNKNVPLALRMRPQNLDEFIGQDHILGEGRLLRRAIISKRVPSLILWGSAGCGKTTLGLIVAKELGATFEHLNAAFSSVAELKKIITKARTSLRKEGKKTVIFIDEVHRFNKLQQESLVPDTEDANISFIGATIYNPHYYLIPSLISRSIVANFKPLKKEEIVFILKRAIDDKERGLGNIADLDIKDEAIDYIAMISSGDARKALMGLEIAAFSTKADDNGEVIIDLEVAKQSIQKDVFYDKKDNYHYDTASALIKSLRGSSPDSALYWLAKMIKGGEDPRFIARRLVILASEDIGNADPQALILATSCFKAVEFVGRPESDLILAQTVVYLACAPKSNSCYMAISRALEDVENESTKEVPSHIKTHSKDYKYPHKFGGYVEQDYGASKQYYFPKDVAYESRLKKFLEDLKK